MTDVDTRVREALTFLTPEEVLGVLQGTLSAIEQDNPGYVDNLILGVLSIRSGMKPGKVYGENERDEEGKP